jgi:hypothetical protein
MRVPPLLRLRLRFRTPREDFGLFLNPDALPGALIPLKTLGEVYVTSSNICLCSTQWPGEPQEKCAIKMLSGTPIL